MSGREWQPGDVAEYDGGQRAFVANPKPPKPEEPTGLGAVVEDVDGIRWLRVCEHTNGCNSWRPFDRVLSDIDKSADARKHWPEVSAVRVLSEGVVA